MPALTLINNRQIADRAAALQPTTQSQHEEPQYTGLAGHIERFWQSAQTAKLPIEQQMLRNLRQRNGIYEPSELAMIREEGGSEIYMMLTSAKCRAAESWLREILLPDSDKAWGLTPSPMPDLPPAVGAAIIRSLVARAQAAGWDINDARIDEQLLKIKTLAYARMKSLSEDVARRHELRIEDQFEDGAWDQAMSDFIYDFVTFPAGVIKAPFIRKKKALKWQPGPDGQWLAVVTEEMQLCYERRSPFDIYPAPAMRDIQRGNLIDRYRFTREGLQELVGVPGYSNEAIFAVLEQYGDKGYQSRRANDTQRAILELRRHEEYDHEGTIEALNFWGSCSGRMLKDWSMHGAVPLGETIDENKEYQIEAWKIAGHIIKAKINENKLGKKPYHKASFEEIPGAFWGYGLPDLGRDAQGMCNGAARAIANNAAIASGPQVEVHVDRLADGEKVTKPRPWKIYQTTSDMRASGGNNPAVHFYQPNMNVQELLAIYNHFERVYDNVSGFPNYSYGDSQVGGAGRTSSGLAQLMGNVGKGVRRTIAAIDRGVTKPIVLATYQYNMENDADASIKGDLRPIARGAAALLTKDQARLRRREMLQATLNPLDAQIIGVKGRAVMLRESLKAEDMPVEEIVPDGLDLALATAGMPPPHELLGNTGPNAPSGGSPDGVAPGGGGGGTPAAAQATDNAGNQPNGVGIRQATQGSPSGYANGGVINVNIGARGGKFKYVRNPDGTTSAEEVLDGSLGE